MWGCVQRRALLLHDWIAVRVSSGNRPGREGVMDDRVPTQGREGASECSGFLRSLSDAEALQVVGGDAILMGSPPMTNPSLF